MLLSLIHTYSYIPLIIILPILISNSILISPSPIPPYISFNSNLISYMIILIPIYSFSLNQISFPIPFCYPNLYFPIISLIIIFIYHNSNSILIALIISMLYIYLSIISPLFSQTNPLLIIYISPPYYYIFPLSHFSLSSINYSILPILIIVFSSLDLLIPKFNLILY